MLASEKSCLKAAPVKAASVKAVPDKVVVARAVPVRAPAVKAVLVKARAVREAQVDPVVRVAREVKAEIKNSFDRSRARSRPS